MNSIELLKESRGLINHCIGKFQMGETELYNAEKLRDRIDEFLAKPAPDAMEIVRQIREPVRINLEEIKETETEIKITYEIEYKIGKSEAAALIESRRVVPRAMLDEIWLNGYQCKDGKKDTDTAEIATKHGYKVEG